MLEHSRQSSLPRKAAVVCRNLARQLLCLLVPELRTVAGIDGVDLKSCRISPKAKVFSPCCIFDTAIGDYTYVSQGGRISLTTIGRFCSIGPHLTCGWGRHPIDGLSTAPMFYSTCRQNGFSLSSEDKITERSRITIGNDVFVGMNVTILDGVNIGDGAVIGAGAVVSKDIPPYAIAYGNPIEIRRFRFDEKTRAALLKIQWWNFSDDHLRAVERFCFDVPAFLEKYSTSKGSDPLS